MDAYTKHELRVAHRISDWTDKHPWATVVGMVAVPLGLVTLIRVFN
jgi:hypothetical protein